MELKFFNNPKELMPISELLSYSGPHNAETKADGSSELYNFISTRKVLEAVDSKVFGVSNFQVNRVRKAGKLGFQKHMIKLQRFEDIGKPESLQIILVNSHDRTSGFRIFAGVFRFVCTNGLVVGNDYGFSVRHIGGNSTKVIDAVYSVIDSTETLQNNIESFKAKQLSFDGAVDFAQNAFKLRFPDETKANELTMRGLTPELILKPKREADKTLDLWTVFNVVQETLVNPIKSRNGRGVQGLKSIDTNLKFNKELWTLAETVRKAA